MALNYRAFEFPGREEGDRRSRDVVHGDVARATQHRLDVTPWPGQCPGALASLRGGRASCRPSDKARTLSRDVGTRQLLLQVMFHILDIIYYILYHYNIIIYYILYILYCHCYFYPDIRSPRALHWLAVDGVLHQTIVLTCQDEEPC